jgi:hypothetical protein
MTFRAASTRTAFGRRQGAKRDVATFGGEHTGRRRPVIADRPGTQPSPGERVPFDLGAIN